MSMVTKKLSKIVKDGPFPANKIDNIVKTSSPIREEVKKICLDLKPGEAVEIDTTKVTHEAIRTNVKRLMKSGEIPQEFRVRSFVKKTGNSKRRRCFIIREA